MSEKAEPKQITARVHVDPETGTMWVLGYPCEFQPDHMADGDGEWHNCDAMGCGSASMHVLAIVKLWDPDVERARAAVRNGSAITPEDAERLARADGRTP
jgi:hypothetical protein